MGCFTNKIGYANFELAKSALLYAQMKDDNRKKPERVFYCHSCKRYHMTSEKVKDYDKEDE